MTKISATLATTHRFIAYLQRGAGNLAPPVAFRSTRTSCLSSSPPITSGLNRSPGLRDRTATQHQPVRRHELSKRGHHLSSPGTVPVECPAGNWWQKKPGPGGEDTLWNDSETRKEFENAGRGAPGVEHQCLARRTAFLPCKLRPLPARVPRVRRAGARRTNPTNRPGATVSIAIRATRTASAGCSVLSARASSSTAASPEMPVSFLKTIKSTKSIASCCSRSSSCLAMVASRASTSVIPGEKSRDKSGRSS